MTYKEKFFPKASKEDVDAVKKFLDGRSKKIELKRVSPEYMSDLAEQSKIEVNWDSMENNGWDYWLQAAYKGKKLLISGSGFYGYGQIDKE